LFWFGYIYYVIFLFLSFLSLIYFYRLIFMNIFYRVTLLNILSKSILGFFLFFLFVSLFTVFGLLDLYTSFNLTVTTNPLTFLFFTVTPSNYVWNYYNLNLNLVSVYYFPFIYIFTIVTVISILTCLAYNINEISAFTFYVTLILIAGYILFFTDSIILFFFAYEMLLIPSFFILYNFAKTRRCVEAAYLMFFWTQFGALFLIFGFLYLFFLCGTSSFSTITLSYFTLAEVNFLLTCLFFGFGVKLPVWPFYGWLPKAHVEASTNFSIFLSGVLVKFAFFGLLKCLIVIQLEPTFYYVYPFLVIGIVDAVFKLFLSNWFKKISGVLNSSWNALISDLCIKWTFSVNAS